MKLFISYRRGDTRDFAGRLADFLRREPQIDEIFLDVDAIDAGADFKARIEGALSKSAVCLVLIGKDWRGESASGAPARIEDAGDFVRLEVARALLGPVKVIPVLVNGAEMPEVGSLPEDLKKLPTLNAISVRHESFRRDANFLADAILARKEPSPLSRYWNRHPFQESLFRFVMGIATAAALLIAGAAAYQGVTGLALNQALGGTGQVVILIATVLVLGGLLPLIFRRRRARR